MLQWKNEWVQSSSLADTKDATYLLNNVYDPSRDKDLKDFFYKSFQQKEKKILTPKKIL